MTENPLIRELLDPRMGPSDVLVEVDLRVADLLKRRCGITDPLILDLVILLVAAQRRGHSCLDLERVDEFLAGLIGESTAGLTGGRVVDSRQVHRPEDLVAALRACEAVSIHTSWPSATTTEESGDVPDAEEPAFDTDEKAPAEDTANETPPLAVHGKRLYSQRSHHDESTVAAGLRRLAGAAPAIRASIDDASIERLIPAVDGDAMTDPQRLAIRTFLESGLTVITGGPGTGKTFTISHALAGLLMAAPTDRPPRIAVCAPTGKAAARTKESLANACGPLSAELSERLIAIDPTTIHKLLRPRSNSRTRFRHDARHPLGVDVIVVDETSMVSLPLLARLVDAIPTGVRLLLVGDPDQLESIASGSVLRDVVMADRDASPLSGRVIRLTTNRRIESGAQIGDLAEAVRRGAADEVIGLLESDSPGITWIPTGHPPDRDEDVLAPILSGLSGVDWDLSDADDLEELAHCLTTAGNHQILCTNRHGPAGVSTWNELVENARGVRGGWYPGRKLLVTRNDNRIGLVNGDVGVVVRVPEGLRACFVIHGEPRLLHQAQLPHVETASALTIHKSQGSEYPNVTAILPSLGSPLLRRELLYTAVTRASRSITLVGTDDAVRAAVEEQTIRMTGLTEALTRP